MPGETVEERVAKLAKDFADAGHRVDRLWACAKCGTSLFDFARRGRLPCLVADK